MNGNSLDFCIFEKIYSCLTFTSKFVPIPICLDTNKFDWCEEYKIQEINNNNWKKNTMFRIEYTYYRWVEIWLEWQFIVSELLNSKMNHCFWWCDLLVLFLFLLIQWTPTSGTLSKFPERVKTEAMKMGRHNSSRFIIKQNFA